MKYFLFSEFYYRVLSLLFNLKIRKQSCKTKFHHDDLCYFVMRKYRHLLELRYPVNDGISWHILQKFIGNEPIQI
jgi:hypothetical protein